MSGGHKIFNLASTETLKKDGGSAWQEVANLPSARHGVRGLGLDNGRFLVTGQSSTTKTSCPYYYLKLSYIFFSLHKIVDEVTLGEPNFTSCDLR